MRVSSSDNFIDPADVELEADDFNSDIEEKKEEITLQHQLIENAKEIEDDKAEDNERATLANLEDELTELEDTAEDILELHEYCENYARGSSLINESYFKEYCEEFAYDSGEISRDSTMSMYVDWEQYAQDCKIDYTTITFEGTDFYVQG